MERIRALTTRFFSDSEKKTGIVPKSQAFPGQAAMSTDKTPSASVQQRSLDQRDKMQVTPAAQAAINQIRTDVKNYLATLQGNPDSDENLSALREIVEQRIYQLAEDTGSLPSQAILADQRFVMTALFEIFSKLDNLTIRQKKALWAGFIRSLGGGLMDEERCEAMVAQFFERLGAQLADDAHPDFRLHLREAMEFSKILAMILSQCREREPEYASRNVKNLIGSLAQNAAQPVWPQKIMVCFGYGFDGKDMTDRTLDEGLAQILAVPNTPSNMSKLAYGFLYALGTIDEPSHLDNKNLPRVLGAVQKNVRLNLEKLSELHLAGLIAALCWVCHYPETDVGTQTKLGFGAHLSREAQEGIAHLIAQCAPEAQVFMKTVMKFVTGHLQPSFFKFADGARHPTGCTLEQWQFLNETIAPRQFELHRVLTGDLGVTSEVVNIVGEYLGQDNIYR